MADQKPPEVNTCTARDCVRIKAGDKHWFDAHMPCWICTSDPAEKRNEMMWNDHCEMYFHRSCLAERFEANRFRCPDGDACTDVGNCKTIGKCLNGDVITDFEANRRSQQIAYLVETREVNT